jgi:ATP-dependent helicase/DNAse subunit B
VLSATGLQGWATCPYRYLLQRVLHVEPTETPVDVWTLGALEKGRIVHGILEAFFRHTTLEREAGSTRIRYTSADVSTLERLAEAEFERSEQSGATGHPLAWEAAQTQIRADLLEFLDEDARWREESGLVPRYFEQAFGMDLPETWPEVRIPISGGSLRFRGLIDRVDVSEDGRRAYVFDYKTGRYGSYMGLEEDPVLAGTQLQMALYTRAARAQLGDDLEVGGAYWFVSHTNRFRRIALPEDRAVVDSRLDQIVGSVAAAIASGVFPAVPGEADRESYKNCLYCPFDRVCSAGRDREWERKQYDGCDAFVGLSALPALQGMEDAQ